MKLRFPVLRTDIQKGCRWDAWNCPVYRGLVRELKRRGLTIGEGGYNLTVDSCEITIFPPNRTDWIRGVVSHRTRQFIDSFDNDTPKNELKPFMAEVNLAWTPPKPLRPQVEIS